MKLPNHTSLKEWSSVIDSLGRGEHVLLIRKGGIADAAFGVEADRFYLFPTYFHTGTSEPPDEVTITHWAEVVRTWRVRDGASLERLAPFTVVDRENLLTRYRFREDQALHLIAVRTFRLPHPTTITVTPEYAGCRSWVSLDDEIEIDGSTPVLSEAELAAKVEAIEAAIA
jgi:hypothetical protein